MIYSTQDKKWDPKLFKTSLSHIVVLADMFLDHSEHGHSSLCWFKAI